MIPDVLVKKIILKFKKLAKDKLKDWTGIEEVLKKLEDDSELKNEIKIEISNQNKNSQSLSLIINNNKNHEELTKEITNSSINHEFDEIQNKQLQQNETARFTFRELENFYLEIANNINLTVTAPKLLSKFTSFQVYNPENVVQSFLNLHNIKTEIQNDSSFFIYKFNKKEIEIMNKFKLNYPN